MSSLVTTHSIQSITITAKWGKEKLVFDGLVPDLTLLQLKGLIHERTNVLPMRMKFLGLSAVAGALDDGTALKALKLKVEKSPDGSTVLHTAVFTLMGTPEAQIFVDPSAKVGGLPDVADDFDSDFTAGSIEWIRSVENSANLSKFTQNTQLFLMNSLRTSPPKPLLVLDLDHTLLDFSSRALQGAEDDSAVASLHESICRPFMHEFLAAMYQQFDIAVWSQTAYVWVEHKLIELGIASNTEYKIVFALDKTSMFKVEATNSDGENHKHYVKPLGVIWDNVALPRGHFSPANTVHIDDLAKNFVLNPGNGVACSAYYRKKSGAKDDVELALLAKYLSRLANEVKDFQTVDHSKWRDVAEGKPWTEKR